MTTEPSPAQSGTYEVHAGDVSGQIIVGSHNTVIRSEGPGVNAAGGVDDEQLAGLREEFARIRSAIAALGAEGRGAGERLDELEESVTSERPSVSLMVYVRDWFVRTLPALAGAVTGLIVHPVAGQLVQQAGDQLVTEYDRHFGDLRSGSDASDR